MSRCSGSWRPTQVGSVVCLQCGNTFEAERLDLKSVDVYRVPKHETKSN